VPQPGTRWQGQGTACAGKPRRVACPLLACWEAGDKAPWLLLTDLAPEASDAGWAGLRAWLAQGFKRTKRVGWQWPRPRMTDPARAARLWLAVAVATLWVVSIGGVVDATIPEGTLPDVTGLCPASRRPRRAPQGRLVRVLRRGWLTLRGALLRHAPLPASRLLPEPWPALRWRREDSAEEEPPTLPRAAEGHRGRQGARRPKECVCVHYIYPYNVTCLMASYIYLGMML
jgi:hypothetical protein